MEVKRGDLFYADLSVGVGSEQSGIRPVVVIQNDSGNRFSTTIIISPLTSSSKKNIPSILVIIFLESGNQIILTISPIFILSPLYSMFI